MRQHNCDVIEDDWLKNWLACLADDSRHGTMMDLITQWSDRPKKEAPKALNLETQKSKSSNQIGTRNRNRKKRVSFAIVAIVNGHL